MRLRNTGDSAHAVTWRDRDSAQTGRSRRGPERTRSSTCWGATRSTTSSPRPAPRRSSRRRRTRRCAGVITVRKLVTGPGAAPPGPWRIRIDGDNGFSATRDLVDGAQAAVEVPGGYQTGSVPIGEVAGGVRYAISEPDPLGAIASVDKSPVTILDGQSEIVTVGNDFPEGPEPPEPPDPPVRRPRSRRCRPVRSTAARTRSDPRGIAGRRGRRRGHRDGVAARERGRRRGVGHHPRAQQRPAAGGRRARARDPAGRSPTTPTRWRRSWA